MGVFETLEPTAPNPEQGALRIRRTIAQAFQQIESSLVQVSQIVERHGAHQIQSALGSDRAEVVSLYGALKAVVEQHKPGAYVPDLPS